MENNADRPEPGTQDERVVTGRPGRGKTGIFMLIGALIVLILVFDLSYKRFMTTHEQLTTTASQLSADVSAQKAAIADLQKTLASVSQTVQDSLSREQQAISEMQSTAAGKAESFTVSEAAYLVNLANDNLQVGDNLPLVIRLLQTADQKLKDSNDANVLPIRKALAADLAALQAVPAVDIGGIYAELSALNGEVDKLPLPNNRPAAADATAATNDQTLPWWRRGLQQSLVALQKIVIVRYTQPGARPFIPPEQQGFLYQNLHANFSVALTALVQRQPDVYRESLKQATGWIQRYFLTDSPVTSSMMTALTRLETVSLRPALPTVAASLQAFRDYYSQTPATDKTSAPPAAQS
jgi:uroporphyrin-3 C-methyltransferase